MQNPSETYQLLLKIRQKRPLVQSITNYVVMNNTANALLALGASPIMSHSTLEVEEMVRIVNALVINIGTLSERWVEGMVLAMKAASAKGIPIVIDPVGAGATTYRTTTAKKLLDTAQCAIIRGNASEIISLYQSEKAETRGVDSHHQSEEAIYAAQELAKLYNCVVSVSGETDYIVEKGQTYAVANGHPLMPLVTGLGCTATVLTAAFAAVDDSPFKAAVGAMVTMGIAGEIAASRAKGIGSMQIEFLDALYNLSETDYLNLTKVRQIE